MKKLFAYKNTAEFEMACLGIINGTVIEVGDEWYAIQMEDGHILTVAEYKQLEYEQEVLR